MEGSHQDAEIEPGDMDQIALVDVLPSTQKSPSHAAAIEDMGEGPLDPFAAPAHGFAPDPRSQPRPVGVDGALGGLVAMPAQIALGRLGFGDARLPHATVQRLQLNEPKKMILLLIDTVAGMIPTFLISRLLLWLTKRWGCALAHIAIVCTLTAVLSCFLSYLGPWRLFRRNEAGYVLATLIWFAVYARTGVNAKGHFLNIRGDFTR